MSTQITNRDKETLKLDVHSGGNYPTIDRAAEAADFLASLGYETYYMDIGENPWYPNHATVWFTPKDWKNFANEWKTIGPITEMFGSFS